ncbi:MAG: hypothetical protein ACRDPM_11395 [Solirubrobacteraceae bacterium]
MPAAGSAAPSADDQRSVVLGLQQTVGNRAVLRILEPAPGRILEPAPSRVLARRRLPSRAHLEQILFDPVVGGGTVDAADAAAHRAGIDRLIGLAEAEMTPAQRAQVTATAHAGLDAAHWAALNPSQQRLREADAIVHLDPTARLGDPTTLDAGPRPGTSDAAHLATLVANANDIFARIATGAVDAHIGQVFGVGNIAAAKAKYANARTRMNQLNAMAPVKIVTDRSGYAGEAGVGGVTTHDQIEVEPSAIDHPTWRESIVTLVHEALHAGNGDVNDDGGYINRPHEFTTASKATKLTNAAHFEVVARRMLGMGKARWAYPARPSSQPHHRRHPHRSGSRRLRRRPGWGRLQRLGSRP